MGESKHKTRKRKLFCPGCLEAPKDCDQEYPGVPKGPKWDNPSIKRGSVFGPGCLEAPKDGEKGYPGVPKGPEWENPS